MHPLSGLEALIVDDHSRVVWRSPSVSAPVEHVETPAVGSSVFHNDDTTFSFALGIRWLGESGRSRRYTFVVNEDKAAYYAELYAFRRTLWLALGASAFTLMALQLLLLRWGLSPLRRLAEQVHEIENAQRTRIEGRFPDELTPLAEGLNAMIRSERLQQTRYRDALGDLAHSLKTPLAVLRNFAEDASLPPDVQRALDEPVSRMQTITDYQLRRASAAGRRTLSEPILVRPIVDKIVAALDKVYHDKSLHFDNMIDVRLRVRVDEGDLYEVFGNLLDNACKWAIQTVRVAARVEEGTFIAEIDDDGPGFPESPQQLLERGVRADMRVPGQGIGLATVAEIVRLNDGHIALLQSGLGGARVRLSWPR
jgi:two-component system sensor histidine kinase PhoQ